MKIEHESITSITPEEKCEQRWKQATRAVVGLSVCACFLLLPGVARANIFTSIITSVTNIGNIEAQLNGIQSSMNNYNNSVVVPPLQLSSLKSWLTTGRRQLPELVQFGTQYLHKKRDVQQHVDSRKRAACRLLRRNRERNRSEL